MDWYLKCFKHYADFDGRARRKEYWMFILFNIIGYLIMWMLDLAIGTSYLGIGLFTTLFGLAVIIPGLAVGVRRLHDTGRSGWWLLISLVPFIGAIVLLIYFLMEGNRNDNQFGPNPKEFELLA